MIHSRTPSEDEHISVHVHRTDYLNMQVHIRRPLVKVSIIDMNTGKYLGKAAKSSSDDNDDNYLTSLMTKPFDLSENRSWVPVWNETLTFDEKISVLIAKQPPVMLLFEISDEVAPVKQTSFKFIKTSKEDDRLRLAWAFLKPVGSDGSLNLNREVRLQLYKKRKSCKVSHNSCDVFHLYSNHTLKKYPGSLFVTVKGVRKTPKKEIKSDVSETVEETNATQRVNNDVKLNKPNFEPMQWSRLPTQSCKIPNSKQTNLKTGRNRICCLKFSNKGEFIACGGQNKIIIFSVLKNEEITTCTGHNGLVYELDWNTDDTLLLSSSGDCTVCVWNIKQNTTSPLQVLPHPSFVYTGKWLPSQHSLLSGCQDHILRYWSKVHNEYQLIQELRGHHGFVSAICVQSTAVFSGDSCGYIFLWKMYDEWKCHKKYTFREITKSVIDSIHIHPGERRLVITARAKGTYAMDISNGVILHSFKSLVNVCNRSISALTPCGNLIFCFGENNVINVWEVDTGKLLATYDNVFGVMSKNMEISGTIDYHKHEHLAGFALFGDNYPVTLLKFDAKKNDSKSLGLTLYTKDQKTKVINTNLIQTNVKEIPPEAKCEDTRKLERVIRSIDKVLTANRVTKQLSANHDDIVAIK